MQLHRPGLALAMVSVALWLGCGSDPVPAIDAGPPADANQVDGASGIECRTRTCEVGTACCVEQVDPPRVSFFCTPGPMQCLGSAFQCDGPEDCAEGEVCCGVDDSFCTPPDRCEGSIACHTLADCPPFTSRCAETPLMLLRICR